MMNHSITVGTKEFYTAQVVDQQDCKHYDQTVIFCHDNANPERAPKLVDYYYGEPDLVSTAQYINEYQRREAANKTKATEEALQRIKVALNHSTHTHRMSPVIHYVRAALRSLELDSDLIDDFSDALRNALSCDYNDKVTHTGPVETSDDEWSFDLADDEEL